MQNEFGIRFCLEFRPFRLEVGAYSRVVVELSIDDTVYGFGFVRQGLLAVLKVYYGESDVTQSCSAMNNLCSEKSVILLTDLVIWGNVDAAVIRATVSD